MLRRRYAGLFFTICVDVNDNELASLEAIHLFVEVSIDFTASDDNLPHTSELGFYFMRSSAVHNDYHAHAVSPVDYSLRQNKSAYGIQTKSEEAL